MSDLIQHDSNFAFLETRDPRLAKLKGRLRFPTKALHHNLGGG
jgi:hypothetical protein